MIKLINKLLYPFNSTQVGSRSHYIKLLESGRFNDRVVYGLSDKDKTFKVLNPVDAPGALFCGGMGSGKSVAMKFTVGTNICTNSEDTIFIFFDALKGMEDYNQFFKHTENVAYAVNDITKIVPLIELLHEEMMGRREEFSRVGAKNINEYNKIVKEKDQKAKKAARIMVCFEEFHCIPLSTQVNYRMNYDIAGSLAYKFNEIMKVGRSYGFNFCIATQRANGEEVPNKLKTGLSLIMAFRMNTPGEAANLNLAHNSMITVSNRGRCAYEEGFLQFPYIDDKTFEFLIEKYKKPFKAKMFVHPLEKFQKSFKSVGMDDLIKEKPIKEILTFYAQYNEFDVVNKLLTLFKFENVEVQKNTSYVVNYTATKYNKKYAIKIYKGRSSLGNAVENEALLKGAKYLNCDKMLLLGFETSSLPTIKTQNSLEIIQASWDVLLHAANIIDNKDNTNFDEFKEMYNTLSISDPRDNMSLEEIQEYEEQEKTLLGDSVIEAETDSDDFLKEIPKESIEDIRNRIKQSLL